MKLEVIRRDIAEITVTDDEVAILLDLEVSHGRARKIVTPIHIEHVVRIAPLFPDEDVVGIDDAVALAVAGANQRADLAIAALKGLTAL